MSIVAKNPKKKKSPFSLVHISGKVGSQEEEAKVFTEAVLDAAYKGELPVPAALYVSASLSLTSRCQEEQACSGPC